MGIARISRTLLILALAFALLAAAACRDDDDADSAAPVETPSPVAADADAGESHDNGDSDSRKDHDNGDSDSGKSRGNGGSGFMDGEDLDLESILELVGAFAAMSEFSGGPDAPGAFDGYGDEFGVIGDSQDAGVWVNGVGVVSAPPDLAELDLGVSATADTVSKARDVAAEAMTAIVAYFIGGGVAPADIRTRHISIQPQYDWQEVIDEGIRRSERVLTGYQVSNTAVVLVRDLDRTSELLDGAVAAGGDAVRVNGISFRIEDTTELAREAREMAVADALARAGELASYSGVVLGRMVYLSEVSAQPPVFAERALASLAADAGASTPVSPGEQEVRITVLAVFDILGG